MPSTQQSWVTVFHVILVLCFADEVKSHGINNSFLSVSLYGEKCQSERFDEYQLCSSQPFAIYRNKTDFNMFLDGFSDDVLDLLCSSFPAGSEKRIGIYLAVPTSTSLPEKCYKPDGHYCSWYRDCLEKKHACASHKDDYAIKYANKFCGLYEENYKSFSVKGQEWIDGVRKCLQVALVPIIQPSFKGNCKDIKKRAFDSHSSCYVNPGLGVPSVCDLSLRDWRSVISTIKTSLVSEMSQTLYGMFEVGSNCLRKTLSSGFDCIIKGFSATALNMISLTQSSQHIKRSCSRSCSESNICFNSFI